MGTTVPTLAVGIGGALAGIAGMNFRSNLENSVKAFYLCAGGIVVCCLIVYRALLKYVQKKRII